MKYMLKIELKLLFVVAKVVGVSKTCVSTSLKLCDETYTFLKENFRKTEEKRRK